MKDGVVAILLASSSLSLPPHQPNPPSKKLKPKSPIKLKPTLLTSTIHHQNISLKYHADLASKLAADTRFEDFLMIAEAASLNASSFESLLNVDLVSCGFSRLLKQQSLTRVVEVLNRFAKLGFDVAPFFDNKDVSTIIRTCVDRRNIAAAIRIAKIFPYSQSQMLFCTIMLEFGKKGDLAAALTVFEASKESIATPNMFAYRTVVDVCGLCGDYMRSRSIYEELLACKCMPNVYVYNSLMNVNACDLRYTLQVYKQMKRLGVRADLATYNILLKSCCLAARVDLARDIYKEVRRLEAVGALKLDVFTYSTIIKVFADAKMWQMALNVKEDMLSAGVTPNTVTWTSLISASANAGLVEQTIHLFEEMLLAGCTPSSQCFNILLHACVEACQYDRAFRLFQSWKENGCHETYGENDGGDKHFSIGIDSVERNCVTNVPNQTSAAHSSHLPLMVPFKPTTSTYNTLMKACGTDYYRAKGLMDEMKKMGLSPNHISWSILIDICGGSGNVEGALQCRF